MVSDLFFGVKPEIIDKFVFNFKLVFALTPVPDFDEITMIFFIPTKVFAQGNDFLFNILNFTFSFFNFVDEFL